MLARISSICVTGVTGALETELEVSEEAAELSELELTLDELELDDAGTDLIVTQIVAVQRPPLIAQSSGTQCGMVAHPRNVPGGHSPNCAGGCDMHVYVIGQVYCARLTDELDPLPEAADEDEQMTSPQAT